MTDTMGQTGQSVQQVERIAGYGQPARFINNFAISFGPEMCRLALGELQGPNGQLDAFYFDTFAIPTEQLVNMAQRILQAHARQQAANKIVAPGVGDVAKFGKRPN